jgi:putative two-component system response regulator
MMPEEGKVMRGKGSLPAASVGAGGSASNEDYADRCDRLMVEPPDTDRVLEGRILVVDDEDANIRLMERVLMREGFRRVRTTTDAREVSNLLAEEPADVIALDLMMPDVDGFEVMQMLRTSDDPLVPVLVLTADATLQTKRRALESGASDFLTKPLDPFEVTLRIKNLLRTRLLQTELRERNEWLEERVRERTADLQRLAADLEELNRTKS